VRDVTQRTCSARPSTSTRLVGCDDRACIASPCAGARSATGYGSPLVVARTSLHCVSFRFEVFVSHVTSNEQPVWFIKGIHDIDGPDEARQRVFMFGRVRSTQGSGRMSWFATCSGNQLGSLRIRFSHVHLNHNRHEFIDGVLTNRPTWLSADDTFDVAGALILDTSPDLSDDALNGPLTRMRNKARKLFTSKANPFNPWELPKL
jgi:hypothetical protein